MDLFTDLLGRNGFLPHGYCFTWSPGLLWSMVVSDTVIAAAYFSIPLVIVTFVRRREHMPHKGVAWLFSAFIFACGITHLMDVWTIWQPDYGVQMLAKAATAIVSIVTAIALWPLLPRALRIPSVEELKSAIGSLEAEIRHRKSAEEHLQALEQSLAVTLASIDAAFIATDRAGKVTRMNEVAERITGWSNGEARGRMVWHVLVPTHPRSALEAHSPVDALIEHGATVEIAQHFTAIARDGALTAVELKAAPTYADDGSVLGMAMVFRDMTQANSAETDRHQLAAIVESSNDAIIGKTLDGRITTWNRAAERMFGYTATEAIGAPVEMLIPPERRAEEMRILAELAHGAAVPPFDTLRQAKDGRLLQVSLTISPIRDAAGRIVGGSKIARDVTEQRRVEAALRESELRLRIALESGQIGEWEMDLATRVTRRSARHDRCFGYAELQPAWSLDILLQHLHPDDRAEAQRSFHAAVDAGQDWHVEARVLWPDASTHWISMHGSLLREGGRAKRMLGVVMDTTQGKLAEEARFTAQRLEAENRQIQQANRLKSQFLANMSHELRTPLNAVIGFADLLYAGKVPTGSAKHHEFLGHIGTSGRHLLQLINDVLDLSKVESGKFEFHPEPIELPQLVREVCNVLDHTLRGKHMQTQVHIDPGLTGLVLDPARLKQALYNYLSNAIKFTPERGRVTIRAVPEGGANVRIEVEDSGIGIAEADLPRLFVEFQQLDSGLTKKHQGTGLGLALTRRLVQAQGGSVGVRSTPGVGSVFHLVLPRVHSGVPDGAPRVHRMLVIEDDGLMQARLAEGLGAAGFQVDAAATAGDALARARQRSYDAITLDLLLPDRRGLDALAGIRSHGASRASPVVAMTLPTDGGAAASFAIANVLCKPIHTEEVVAAMTRFRLPDPRRANVMVIDDDALALDLMRATLKGIGIHAVCLLDGRRALAEIEQHRPDAIVLDLMMPEFDGFAVLDALRRMPAWRDTPVFIWTSMLLTDAEYAALAHSAQAILAKGGGALAEVMEALRRWRPAHAVPAEGRGP